MDYYYCVKVIFVAKYVAAMVFGDGILGGAHKIWGNPYLNSTTVLFDFEMIIVRIYVHIYPYLIFTTILLALHVFVG